MKICKDCGVEKPLTEFHKAGVNGHHVRCKPCRKKFRSADKETTFAYSLRTRFNITVDRYNEIFEAQGRVCAVCKSPEPVGSPYWQVDHDHRCCPGRNSCGKCIRGILCSNCNLGLGVLEKMNALEFNFTDYVDRRA